MNTHIFGYLAGITAMCDIQITAPVSCVRRYASVSSVDALQYKHSLQDTTKIHPQKADFFHADGWTESHDVVNSRFRTFPKSASQKFRISIVLILVRNLLSAASHSCPDLYSRHQHRQTDRQTGFVLRQVTFLQNVAQIKHKIPFKRVYFVRVGRVTASSYIVCDCTIRWTYGPVQYICTVCTHFYKIYLFILFLVC